MTCTPVRLYALQRRHPRARLCRPRRLTPPPSPSRAAQTDPVLSWCALGFSRDKSGSMAPADATMLSVSPAAPTVVVLEDRNLTSYVAPACAAEAASTVLSSAVNADGSVTASWTRALVPTNGAAPIVNGFTFVIAAIASSASRAAFTPCYTVGMPQHNFYVAKIPLNFFEPPPSL
jgi:hypothetical protein